MSSFQHRDNVYKIKPTGVNNEDTIVDPDGPNYTNVPVSILRPKVIPSLPAGHDGKDRNELTKGRSIYDVHRMSGVKNSQAKKKILPDGTEQSLEDSRGFISNMSNHFAFVEERPTILFGEYQVFGKEDVFDLTFEINDRNLSSGLQTSTYSHEYTVSIT